MAQNETLSLKNTTEEGTDNQLFIYVIKQEIATAQLKRSLYFTI